jgi:hypothetical protein
LELFALLWAQRLLGIGAMVNLAKIDLHPIKALKSHTAKDSDYHTDSTLGVAADAFLLSWSQEYKEKGTMQRIEPSDKALRRFEEESEHLEDTTLFVEMFR